MKKIGTIVLAIMMIAMVGLAYAGTNVNDGNVYVDDSQTVVSGTSIPMNKSIVFINANGSQVYEPNITFRYSVAPVTGLTAETKVTDDGELNKDNENNPVPVTVTVNDGVSGGVYFNDNDSSNMASEIKFSSANLVASTSANGTEIQKTTNLSVDLSKFQHAGVYRYVVTEITTQDNVTSVGMETRANDYDSTRYLDVYIKNEKINGVDKLVLYGAVFFKTTSTTTADKGKDIITVNTKKTTGFEPGTPDDTTGYKNDGTVDRYVTYDFKVMKVIAGGLADKSHEFPFYVSVSNSIDGAAFTYTADGNETFIGAAWDSPTKYTLSADSFTIGTETGKVIPATTEPTIKPARYPIKLKDTEFIELIGIPSSKTHDLAIVIKEWNDTVDQYTASTGTTTGTLSIANTNESTSDPKDTSGRMTASIGSMETVSFDLKTNDVASQILTITNTLDEISPTGYVTRFAPYALILVGGILLLIISKKHKKSTDED